MANTQYALFSYSMIDELGTKTSMNVPAMIDPTTGTPAALKTEWLALGGQLDDLVGAQILSGSVAVVLKPDPGWKTVPASGSRVEQTGLFNFANATSKYKFGVDIPSIVNTAISGGKIDLTTSIVTDVITSLLTAFTGGVFTNTSQYPLSALADALLSFRKRRKQLSRTSFEPGA
jgi:hypothetical protein